MGRNCALPARTSRLPLRSARPPTAQHIREDHPRSSKVLGGRRHDSGGDDQSFLVQGVTVIENTARRLSDRLATPA